MRKNQITNVITQVQCISVSFRGYYMFNHNVMPIANCFCNSCKGGVQITRSYRLTLTFLLKTLVWILRKLLSFWSSFHRWLLSTPCRERNHVFYDIGHKFFFCWKHHFPGTDRTREGPLSRGLKFLFLYFFVVKADNIGILLFGRRFEPVQPRLYQNTQKNSPYNGTFLIVIIANRMAIMMKITNWCICHFWKL